MHSAYTARLRSSYFREMVELSSSVDSVDHDMINIIGFVVEGLRTVTQHQAIEINPQLE